MKKLQKDNDQWRKELTPERYRVTREKGTEKPFSGSLLHNKEEGTYVCGSCGAELFLSQDKYDSGSGWPSFADVIDARHVSLRPDTSHGMHRTEVTCRICDAHLGHVFDDGPTETGKRYCINSIALDFQQSGSEQ